jgi:hypothetical protein
MVMAGVVVRMLSFSDCERSSTQESNAGELHCEEVYSFSMDRLDGHRSSGNDSFDSWISTNIVDRSIVVGCREVAMRK